MDLRATAAADSAELIADAGEDATLTLAGYTGAALPLRVVLGAPAGSTGQDAGIATDVATVTARAVQTSTVDLIRDATGTARWPAEGDLLTVRGQEYAVQGCRALMGDAILMTCTAGRAVAAGARR